MTAATPEVAAALDAVRDQFPTAMVETVPDGDGGLKVIVDPVDLGSTYQPSSTWFGFHITAAYPHADVYPHFVGVVARVDGQPLGDAIQSVTWQERPALQISRRSNRWNSDRDTAANKAEKVITWMRTR